MGGRSKILLQTGVGVWKPVLGHTGVKGGHLGKGGALLSHLSPHCPRRGPLEMYQDHHQMSTGMRQKVVARALWLKEEYGYCGTY